MRRFWRTDRAPAAAADPPDTEPSVADLARAARLLVLRARREATGSFAGSYTAAFRGGGMEFEESRPYVVGDDVRNFDWSATARTGEPYVKRFREERDQLLLVALDVSASMRFGTAGRSKASAASHALALIAAAAGRAGDRVGLVTFDDSVRDEIPPAQGPAHSWRIIETAVAAARRASNATRLDAAVDSLLGHAAHRASIVLISDFRDDGFLDRSTESGAARVAGGFAGLCHRHDVVSVVVSDPREATLPRVGLVRVRDPERPGRTLLLNTNSARTRARYQRSWMLRARALERGLRSSGSDVVSLETHRDPLTTLAHFFRRRAALTRGRA